MSLNIVFMGTSEFSVSSIEALIEKKINILAAYTQPAKKSKRGHKFNPSPVEEFCIKKKIELRSPKNLNNEEEFKFFKELSPDVVIVVSYGQIIPKKFFKTAKFEFINIHASLLPRWRGAAPIQRAIMNRDKKIGVSIMKIEEKLDSGPVLRKKELRLDKNLTHGEIEKKLSLIGAELLIECLQNIEKTNSECVEQIHSEATYAKKINKEETKINWNLDANTVLAHIHALSPSPGAWFVYENERYKVLKVKISKNSGAAGSVIDKNLIVACKINSIEILEIQRQGKKKQSTKEFLLGKKISIGSFLF